MSKVRWRLYYHVVWATKGREPLIDDEIRPRLLGLIRSKCAQEGIAVNAVNAVADHVHLCCEIPPSMSISFVVGQIKGSASHLTNHALGLPSHFAWQTGFGVTSLSHNDLPRVVDYIHNQQAHHATGKLWPSLESTEETEDPHPKPPAEAEPRTEPAP